MARRQLVGVLTRLQHVGRLADAVHHLLQRTASGRPLAEVAVDADEVLLEKRPLRPAQQRLIDDLALAEYVLQPVTGKATCQAPPDGYA